MISQESQHEGREEKNQIHKACIRLWQSKPHPQSGKQQMSGQQLMSTRSIRIQFDVRNGQYLGRKRERCVLREHSKSRNIWDLIISLISITHFIYLSLLISFEEKANLLILIFTELTVIAVYSVDLVFNLRTSFINKEGDLVVSCINRTKSVAFFYDVFCLAPFGLFSIFLLQILSLIRIGKSHRIWKLIRALDISLLWKARIKFGIVVIYLVVVFHFFTCLWILYSSEDWIPPFQWINPSYVYHPETLSPEVRYLHSLYYMLMGGLASGQIGPVGKHDCVISPIIILAGSILNASTFAILTQKIIELNSATQSVQSKINDVNTIMVNLRLGPHIKRELRKYFYSTEQTLNQQEELTHFLQILSPSLRTTVLQLKFAQVISQNLIFRNSIEMTGPDDQQIAFQFRKFSCGQQNFFKNLFNRLLKREKSSVIKLRMISSMMKPILCKPEDVVIEYGDVLSGVFFISQGACRVLKRRLSSRQEKVINELGINDNFGEISMVFNSPAFAKVQSSKYSILGKLEKQQFVKLNRCFPSFYDKLKADALGQTSRWKARLSKVLERTPYFQRMKREELCSLIYTFSMRQFDQGTVVFSEGEEMKGLWIIMRGYIVLYYRGIPVTILNQGTVINYDRLSVMTKHQVTAKSATFTTCAFLPNEQITTLIEKCSTVAQAVSEAALDYFRSTKLKEQITVSSIKSSASNFTNARQQNELKQIVSSFDYQTHLNSRKPLFKLKNAVLRIISFKRLQRRNIAVGEYIQAILKNKQELNCQRNFSSQIENLLNCSNEQEPEFGSLYSLYELNARIDGSMRKIIRQLALNSSNMNSCEKALMQCEDNMEEDQGERRISLSSSPFSMDLEAVRAGARSSAQTSEGITTLLQLLNFEQHHKNEEESDSHSKSNGSNIKSQMLTTIQSSNCFQLDISEK